MNEHPGNHDDIDIDSGRTDDFEFEKLAKKYGDPDAQFVARKTEPKAEQNSFPSQILLGAEEEAGSAAKAAKRSERAGGKRPHNPNGKWQRVARSPYLYLGLTLVFSVLISVYGIICMNDILAINKSADSVTITVGENFTTSQMVDLLKENKLIKSKLFCKIYAKIMGYSNNYSQGTFYLNGKMGLEGMLLEAKAQVNPEKTVSVTIPEGYTIMQVISRLGEAEVCNKDALIAALNSKVETSSLAAAIPSDNRRFFALEGYLFPDTYEFYVGESPNEVINTFLKNLESKVTAEDREKAQKMGLTMDQVLTIASIIEKEAANKEQMAGISAVIHNRLSHSSQFPYLQCDSTGDYLNRTINPNLSMRPGYTLEFYQDNYNTYTGEGLPVGPICNPGANAIKAALNPSASRAGYYYFNHNTKTGKIYYAKTKSEHDANVARVERENSSGI